MEDDIFRRRKQKEDGIAASKARRSREEKDRENARKANNAAALAANRPSSSTRPGGDNSAAADPNKSAAAALKMSLGAGAKRDLGVEDGGSDAKRPKMDEEEQSKNSQAAEEFLNELKAVMEQKRVVEQEDDVCLHQGGWKQRYYRSKFGVDVSEPENAQFPRRVVQSFMEGICWTLLYYYRGCPSWIWCVPPCPVMDSTCVRSVAPDCA
jgi:5'-3' exoribonuclease 2